MILVKKFSKSLNWLSPDDKKSIDDQINEWIKENQIKVVDIKYTVTANGYERVLVMYEERSAK